MFYSPFMVKPKYYSPEERKAIEAKKKGLETRRKNRSKRKKKPKKTHWKK